MKLPFALAEHMRSNRFSTKRDLITRIAILTKKQLNLTFCTQAPYHFINIPVNVCVRTSSATSIALGVEVDFDCDVEMVAKEDFLA